MKLTSLVEQSRCRRNGEGAVERHLQCADVVPRKFPADEVMHDQHMIALRIERGDALGDVVSAHWSRVDLLFGRSGWVRCGVRVPARGMRHRNGRSRSYARERATPD